MAATRLVARGPSIFLFRADADPREFRGSPAGADPPPRPGVDPDPAHLPPVLIESVNGTAGAGPVEVLGPALRAAVAARLRVQPLPLEPRAWQQAFAHLPPFEPRAERDYLLARARADLAEAFRSPEEVLVSLAREEERFERSVGREARAGEAFVAVPGTPLDDYARAWAEVRSRLSEHHRDLRDRLEGEARRSVPNLAAVVGPRVAARLVAAAGGIAPLARMSASRLQLLGSRRRPSPERGPRYGAVYLAEGMDEVPPDRRAAYARSVAALAAIAVRADAVTHADLAAELVRRRRARIARLRRKAT